MIRTSAQRKIRPAPANLLLLVQDAPTRRWQRSAVTPQHKSSTSLSSLKSLRAGIGAVPVDAPRQREIRNCTSGERFIRSSLALVQILEFSDGLRGDPDRRHGAGRRRKHRDYYDERIHRLIS